MENYFPQSADEYIALFLRRKRYFLIPFFAVLALTALVYPFLPRVYTSTALLQIEDEQIIQPLIEGLAVKTDEEKRLKALTSQMLSWHNMTDMVQRVGLWKEGDGQARLENLVDAFAKRIEVKPVPTAPDVLSISFNGSSPDTSQAVVAALTESLLEQNRKAKRAEAARAITFIQDQLRDYKFKLQDSEKTFLDNSVKSQLNQLLQRREILTSQLARMESRITTQVTKGQDPVVERLRNELSDATLELNRLRMDATDEHPMVRELEQRVKDLEDRLKREQKNAVSIETSETNPAYEKVSLELKEVNMEIGSLETRLKAIQSGDFKPKNVPEQDLLAMERDKQVNEDIYKSLLVRLENAHISKNLDENAEGGSIRVVQEARRPAIPSSPKPLAVLGMALMLGALCGGGAIFLREYFDTSLRSVPDAKNYLELPLLAAIPKLEDKQIAQRKSAAHRFNVIRDASISPKIVTFHHPESAPAEQFRLLRTHLLSLEKPERRQAFLLTSAMEGEGKTTTAVNLAVCMAQELGTRTLLIDADLRKGTAAERLGLSPRQGLADVLSGRCSLSAAVTPLKIDHLSFLPAGTPTKNSTGLLSSHRLQEVMEALRADYDHILIDAPPVLSLADVPVLLPHADAAFLVVQLEKTRREMVAETLAHLQQAPGARVAGFVLTHVDRYFSGYFQQYQASKYYMAAGV